MSPAFGLAAYLLLAAGSDAAPPGGPGAAPADSTREFALPEVIVEAPRPIGRGLPYPETTLDPARWGAQPAKDLSDLVETAPAAHVRRSGGPGSPSFLSLRGAPPEGVLVLQDGERLNAAQGGGVDLSQVPLSGISRVEVIRGGASLLYGASALGGVVQIVSGPSAPRDVSEVALEGGSLGTYAGSASLTRAFRGGWVRALGRSFHTEGSFLYERPGGGGEVVRLNSGGSAHLLDARGEVRTGIGALRAALRSSRSDGGSPGLAEFPTPEARREEVRDAAQLRLERRASEVSAGWARSERTYSDPADPLGAFEARHRATAASLRATARERRGAVTYEGGIDARHETLRSTTDGDRARRTGAVFGVVAADWPLGTTWTLGARWEATTSFRPVPSTGAGVSWDAGLLRARAMAGTSYRPPTFDDLFWPATGMAVGNPDLRPERASDWDVGVDLRPRRFLPRVSIDAYGRDVRDLIVWTPGPSGIWRPSNVGRADVRGVEASLVWNEAEGGSLPRVEIAATLQRARDRSGEPNTDGRDLPGRPRRLFAARLEKAFGARVHIEMAWRAIGDVPRTAANTKGIPGYAIGSVGARFVALSWLTASAGVDNIGDVAYEDFHDFPLPGRVYRVAFALRSAEGEPVDARSEAGQ